MGAFACRDTLEDGWKGSVGKKGMRTKQEGRARNEKRMGTFQFMLEVKLKGKLWYNVQCIILDLGG